MLKGWRQLRAGDWGAVVWTHDPLGKQEVTEQTGDQEILAEQLLEKIYNHSDCNASVKLMTTDQLQ